MKNSATVATPTEYEDLRDLPVRDAFIGYDASIFTLETRYRGLAIKNSIALADIDFLFVYSQ